MNQILSVENNNNDNNKYKYKKNKSYGSGKKFEIKSIIIFFCIILIIFGIFIIGNGAYSIYSKSKSEEGNDSGTTAQAAEPELSIQVVSDIEIKLIITHSKEIKFIEYSWNNGETEKKDGNGKKNVEISNIEVPPGEDNLLKVIVTDIDNNTTEFERMKSSTERPLIKLSAEQNAIRVEIESKTSTIDYVTYYWDNEEPKRYTINAPKTANTLEVKDAGEHTLYMTAVDKNGNQATKTKKIKAVKAPEIKVTTDGQNFIIRASDEEEIQKVVINLNGNEVEKEVNQKQYEEKVGLADGENKIIVTVYNNNGVTKQARLKYIKQ